MVKYKELQPGDRVHFLWIDSSSTAEWLTPDEFHKLGKNPWIHMEATIYERVKHGVLVYNVRSVDGELYCGCWFVARVCIKRIERLP